jgi:hypothetical protein
MHLRFSRIELVGSATVGIDFRPGFNVVAGPIQTGKTSLWRLMRFALATRKPNDNPPEIEAFVKAVGANLTVGDEECRILRPFVATPTSLVDVITPTDALLLPARAGTPQYDETYASWMMQKLALPQVEVRRRRTDPESELEPLSLADFLEWSFLKQDALELGFFNAEDSFRETKRRYVFEYVYGISDPILAEAEGRLSFLLREASALEQRNRIIKEFLRESGVASREEVRERIEQVDLNRNQIVLVKTTPPDDDRARSLRSELIQLDKNLSELEFRADAETGSANDLRTLEAQLRTQMMRLNRAIVSDMILVDFAFEECPSCGQSVPERPNDSCPLCAQALHNQMNRSDLLGERERVIAQLGETLELRQSRLDGEQALRSYLKMVGGLAV